MEPVKRIRSIRPYPMIMKTINTEKRKVYVVQYASSSTRNLAPLSAALLKSAALSNNEIAEFYNIAVEYRRFDVDIAVERFNNPEILAFSVYLWNFNQSIKVAKRAKEKYNNCFILFGGPSCPITKENAESFFDKYPFVDILVWGEGEIAFTQILLSLKNNQDFSDIKGIFYKKNGITTYTGRADVIKDLSRLSSPYIDGTFDGLVKDNYNDFTGFIVETNRGCPYNCTFCSWGIIQPNLSLFPLERVYAELDWISNNKINYIYLGDANFGIAKRDIDIAKYIARLKENTGYPKFVAMCWAKHSNDTVFEIAKILTDVKIPMYISMSVQSFNQDTLEAIKRKNMGYDNFLRCLKEAGEKKFNISTDIIIGLPLETYHSFRRGISKLFNGVMSFYFNVVYFNLLPGTEAFNNEYIRKYDIKTKHCQFQLAKSAEKNNGVLEFNDIVVSTSTMTIEDWKRMNNLGFYVKAIYNYRLAFFIFNYLKDKFNVDLVDFIEYLLKKGEAEEADFPIISRTIKILKATQANILKEESCLVKLDSISFLLYPDFAVFIILIESIESFYAELYRCVLSYIGGKVDCEILKEVFLYQYLIVPKWKTENYYRARFNYNFNEYFTQKKELVKKENFCIIGCKDIAYSNIEELVQKTIYGNVVFNLLGIKEVTKEEFGKEFKQATEITHWNQ